MVEKKPTGITHNIFGPQEDKPLAKTRLLSRESHLPVCKTLEDLARLTLGEPTEEELRGFRACLEALHNFPESFIEMAWETNQGWSSYHALDEVNEICTPIVKKWAGIILYALAIQERN